MPHLRQKPGGPVILVGTGKAPLRTAPVAGSAGATGGTGTAAAPDGVLVLSDGAWLVLPGGDALALPGA